MSRTLHLVALPHTQTTTAYASCAYTQKIVKFCRMMTSRGWDVVLYAGEENEAPCAEHVQLISEAERRAWFGEGFDTVLTPLSWDANQPYWRTQTARARAAIRRRSSERDLILLSTGTQWAIRDAFPTTGPRTSRDVYRVVCEPFVGYEGIATDFCAFESATFMHTVYAKRGIDNGRDMDAVIPNFFDPAEFPHVSNGARDYLLYVGRIMWRKGIAAAAEIAREYGMPLLVAGPGATEWSEGLIVAPGFRLEDPNVTYLGEIGVEERARLMAGAYALLAPTVYLEPFGGVAVEAQMCGTPAITTDHGAFMETVDPPFRFRSMQQALDALESAGQVDRLSIRHRAMARYSLEAVAPLYETWFGRLLDLWGKGWYELRDVAVAQV